MRNERQILAGGHRRFGSAIVFRPEKCANADAPVVHKVFDALEHVAARIFPDVAEEIFRVCDVVLKIMAEIVA